MEERKRKRKSGSTSASAAAPGGSSVRGNSAPTGARNGGYSHDTGTHSGQKSRSRRGLKPKSGTAGKASQKQGQAAPTIQHSFLTDVSDIQEMENGLLSLLNDFHSGKLEAFGNECSIGQLEHVREMQEKLARLHFDLYSEVDEMPEDQKMTASDTNMDKLLLNLEELSSSIQKLNLADTQEMPKVNGV